MNKKDKVLKVLFAAFSFSFCVEKILYIQTQKSFVRLNMRYFSRCQLLKMTLVFVVIQM